MIKNAQYGDLRDDLLLDKVICSIKDHNIRERLWLDRDITLEKAIEICRSKEISEKQLKGLDGNNMEINKIQRTSNTQQQSKYNRTPYKCKFCGNDYHDNLENCPSGRVNCRKCGKRGHYARVCMLDISNNDSKRNSGRTVKQISTAEDKQQELEDRCEYVLNVSERCYPKGLFKDLIIYGEKCKSKLVKTQLDTGHPNWIGDPEIYSF